MNMKNETLSLKQVILDISSMGNFARKLLKKQNSYNDIIEFLITKNLYYDEDSIMPTIKEIIQELNYTYGKFKKELLRLYNDLTEHDIYNDEAIFDINDVEYHFTLKSFGKYAYFKLNKLPAIPKVGENVYIPFFYAKLESRYFYVKDIRHNFKDGKQIVNIRLEEGHYNLYWHFRKDEAVREFPALHISHPLKT